MVFLKLGNELSPELKLRWQALLNYFSQLSSVVVAFSGGVDSGLLCAVAYAALGNRMLAISVRSPVESVGDIDSAQELAKQIGFSLRVIDYDDLTNPEFVSNTPERCYFCKKSRFQLLKGIAAKEGYETLVEGTNADDSHDYRPGRRAIIELSVNSPLLELGFTKHEIRALTKALKLSVSDRPSAPCLATRFPYGSPITIFGLQQISKGEEYLQGLGFQIIRVRHYGDTARLEIEPDYFHKLLSFRQQIIDHFKELGFYYITLDLAGYRQGSQNEILK